MPLPPRSPRRQRRNPQPASQRAAPAGEVEPAEAGPEPAGEDGAGEDGAGDAKATPVARRVAEQEGVPLAEVKGSGRGGQVTKDDVLAHVAGRHEETTAEPELATPAAAAQPDQGGEESYGMKNVAPPADDDPTGSFVTLQVQRLAATHNINLREIAAGRKLGQVTVDDVLAAVAKRRGEEYSPRARAPLPVQQPPATGAPAGSPAAPVAPAPPPGQAAGGQPAAPAPATAAGAAAGAADQLVPHTRMRSLIAKNTVQSAFSIPHVTTMWDVKMAAVLAHRQAHKAEFAAQGVKLTLTPYFVVAALDALRKVPAANSSWSDEGVILRKQYNIGIAVALPADQNGMGGLIVPVIRNAGDLNLVGIARAVADVADRARANKLQANDLMGGTFTVTNYGTSGSRFQTPVIVGGQAGILGVGAIEKRAVVVSQGSPLDPNVGDYLAFLPMTTLGFSYDHRILDGATADAFCAAVKDALENWK